MINQLTFQHLHNPLSYIPVYYASKTSSVECLSLKQIGAVDYCMDHREASTVPDWNRILFSNVLSGTCLSKCNEDAQAQIARWFGMREDGTCRRTKPSPCRSLLRRLGSDDIRQTGILRWTLEDQALLIQRSDEELRKIMEILEKQPSDSMKQEATSAKHLKLKEDWLLRQLEDDGRTRLLYAMPKSMRKNLCVKLHDLQGHFALDRTVAKVTETYWFPGIWRY